MYLFGSKFGSDGPTNLINKSEDTIFVINETLVRMIMRFICENPRSASLEEMGIVLSGEILTKSIFHES